MRELLVDLERFYALLALLAEVPGQGQPLGAYTGRCPWPARGVYFFMEPGEARGAPPAAARIVRVGTHAVSANASSSLWGRLRTHRGSCSGGGNHRGSIFRLHVGAALLAAEGGHLSTWGAGVSAPREVREAEATHEQRVSAHLGAMPVMWVDVPDAAGPQSNRAVIERNAIALLSNHLAPMDPPSSGWLGRHSPRKQIVGSGLWNLNHIDEQYDRRSLDVLEACVLNTCRGRPAPRG